MSSIDPEPRDCPLWYVNRLQWLNQDWKEQLLAVPFEKPRTDMARMVPDFIDPPAVPRSGGFWRHFGPLQAGRTGRFSIR